MSFNHGRKVTGTFRAPAEMLSSPGLVSTFLRELVKRIGMTALGHHIYDVPMAVKRLGQDPLTDEGGVTGITVLSTSHAAIHTWPEEGAARFDVDSCRPFDDFIVEGLIREVFQATEVSVYDVSYTFQPDADVDASLSDLADDQDAG